MVFTSPAQADFGVTPGGFHSSLLDSAGAVETEPQAGAHPFAQQVEFSFNATTHHEYPAGSGGGPSGPDPDPDDQVKTIVTELPPGLIGNPQAVPICAQSDFPPASGLLGLSRCPTDAQIGVASLDYGLGSGYREGLYEAPVYNLVAPKGVIARVGFVIGEPVVVDIKLRTGSDYGLTAIARTTSQSVNFYGFKMALWGVPADSSHDTERYLQGATRPGDPPESGNPLHSELPRIPFLSNPTRCGVDLPSFLRVDSWQDPGNFLSYTDPQQMRFSGCNQLQFEPTIESKPTTTLADAPSGQEFDLHIPQNEDVEGHEDPDGLTAAHLRDAVVTLPAGMTVNPPAADVLSACSLDQVGISAAGVPSEASVTCPNQSILGKATVVTPALDHVLNGTVYLARQSENPFGSLFAMYLVIDDPQTGLLIKLAGKIDPDPSTGQLTVSFRENPQTPVEDLTLNLFGGPHAALKTPEGCGDHTTTSSLTPWTAPEAAVAHPISTFTLSQGPDGGACRPTGAGAPNTPSFTAGTADPTAKAFTPFTFKLARADGSQQLGAVDTTLPDGLLGKLAGIPYCPDGALATAAGKSGRSEQSSPS
ncbi:MAG TPA: hypothetical protein VGO13_08540, partial [Solirubrobacterales bacterium]|nr:hypothetical protein [Solirubrobacterales bacterium]